MAFSPCAVRQDTGGGIAAVCSTSAQQIKLFRATERHGPMLCAAEMAFVPIVGISKISLGNGTPSAQSEREFMTKAKPGPQQGHAVKSRSFRNAALSPRLNRR
jgi:hypothetical protein